MSEELTAGGRVRASSFVPVGSRGHAQPPSAQAAPWDDWGSYSGPPEAALVYPPPLGTTITIDGPPNVWQMRLFAERLDAALPGVEVVSAPAAALPDALHVTVVKTDTRDFGWVGSTEWSYAPGRTDAMYPTDVRISLSTKLSQAPARLKRYVAAHEFMHVLGFRHHGGSGLVGIDRPSYYSTSPLPSPAEWTPLHAYFGGSPAATPARHPAPSQLPGHARLPIAR